MCWMDIFGSFVITEFICMVNDVQQTSTQSSENAATKTVIGVHNGSVQCIAVTKYYYGFTAVECSIPAAHKHTHSTQFHQCNNRLWIIDICINALVRTHTNTPIVQCAKLFRHQHWCFEYGMKGVWNIHWMECITTALHLCVPRNWPFKNDIERLSDSPKSMVEYSFWGFYQGIFGFTLRCWTTSASALICMFMSSDQRDERRQHTMGWTAVNRDCKTNFQTFENLSKIYSPFSLSHDMFDPLTPSHSIEVKAIVLHSSGIRY